jgi:hypothetical protein
VFNGHCDVLDSPYGLEAASLGGGRQMAHQCGIAESSGIGKADP